MENLEIKNMADVRSFIYYLMVELELGGGFHPDTHMTEYSNWGTGGETFPTSQAHRLQKQLDQCFTVCEQSNEDIYEQGMELGYAMGYFPRPDDLEDGIEQEKQSDNTEGRKMFWRCHIRNLCKEVMSNKSAWVLKMPFTLFLRMLYDLGKISERINDPELNAMMLRLAIFEDGDPTITMDTEKDRLVDDYISKHSRNYA